MQGLNPLVEVKTINNNITIENISNIINSNITCICLWRNYSILKDINKLCRNKNIPLYSVEAFGFYGTLIADLIEYEYLEY